MSEQSSNGAVCIIPARGVSSQLPKRNFKQVGGKPMVAYTIESALDVDAISSVFVSTESERLASIAKEHGARVPFLRHDSLSADDVLLPEVIEHSVQKIQADVHDVEIGENIPVVVLQPNVPFRRSEEIDAAIETFQSPSYDSVISVTEERNFYWQDDDGTLSPTFDERGLRSDLEPFYRETGSIYVTSTSLLAEGTRVGHNVGYVATDKLSAFEVSSILDLWIAERIADGPKIVFRVDGGDDIGMGHVYRCLTIAKELDARIRADITFVSDEDFPAGVEKLNESCFDVVPIGESEDERSIVTSLDPDIAFLDVLDTNEQEVGRLQETSAAVVNLEDLEAGLQHADFVINALYERSDELSNHKFGADYFILREEFEPTVTDTPETVDNLLLTFGGSDPGNLTTKTLSALEDTLRNTSTTVVLGPGFEHHETLSNLPDELLSRVTFRENVSNMAELMDWADLAIVSGGRTVYELAAMGTPAVVVTQNEREHERMSVLDEKGILKYVGKGDSATEGQIFEAVRTLRRDRAARKRMSESGMEYVDGNGTQRVLDIVFKSLFGLQGPEPSHELR